MFGLDFFSLYLLLIIVNKSRVEKIDIIKEHPMIKKHIDIIKIYNPNVSFRYFDTILKSFLINFPSIIENISLISKFFIDIALIIPKDKS